MSRFGGVTFKAVAVGLLAFIVIGGFALAALGIGGRTYAGTPAPGLAYYNVPYAANAAESSANGLSSLSSVITSVATTTMSTTTASAPTTIVIGSQNHATAPGSPSRTTSASGNGTRMVEFFTNVTMESPSPESLASKVVGLAYSVGGYVAYQSTSSDSAYVIIRVPASLYQQTLSQVQAMGNVTSLMSNSNDVTVQYTNLNATLVSLEAEQQALLRLINATTKVNDTLAIEATLQSVDAQLNFVQSEMLQTQRLVAYSTITVSISKSVHARPLTMTLSATPKSGVSPLGVTFNAVVSGGKPSYVVNYNFGDGSSQQGQIVIHQFYEAGDYNVTASVTDSAGSVTMASTIVHVLPAPSTFGFGNFPTTLADLFVRVLEGMATVAVVVLPVAGVLAVVLVPIRRRGKPRGELRQG